MSPAISIIIPALNEADHLAATLAPLTSIPDVEVIVVDGGSKDATCQIARDSGAKVLVAKRGRGTQMNLGGSCATGEILLFLHADTTLLLGEAELVSTLRAALASPPPPEAPPKMSPEMSPEDHGKIAANIPAHASEKLPGELPGAVAVAVAGAFGFRVDAPGWQYRQVEKLVAWRSRRLGLPYGDQGLFLLRQRFEQMNGFAPIPLMEDYDMMVRLKKQGSIKILPLCVQTSARRWQRCGILWASMVNLSCVLAYHCHISPSWIARWRRASC